jgi:hypothetical protein
MAPRVYQGPYAGSVQYPSLSRCVEYDTRHFTARVHEQHIDGPFKELTLQAFRTCKAKRPGCAVTFRQALGGQGIRRSSLPLKNGAERIPFRHGGF